MFKRININLTKLLTVTGFNDSLGKQIQGRNNSRLQFMARSRTKIIDLVKRFRRKTH